MIAFSAKITDGTSIKTVNPDGLQKLILNIQKSDNEAFFRKRLNGELVFQKEDFNSIKTLQEKCCNNMPIDIYRSCFNDAPFVQARINSRKINWNLGLCQAKVSIDTLDIYKEVIKHSERSVNVLELAANRELQHVSRSVVPDTLVEEEKDRIETAGGTVLHESYINGSEKQVSYVINNERGRAFNDVILYVIKKSFENTSASSVIPYDIESCSKFLSDEINICTGKKNIAKYSIVFQASDIVTPISSKAATAQLEDGNINEDMTMNFKELMSNLKALFDLDWWVDRITGRLRIEHSSYIEQGGSYTDKVVGFDFTDSKYKKSFKNYNYSFTTQVDKLSNEDTVTNDLNVSLVKGKKALPYPLPDYDEDYGYYFDGYLKIDDFDYGNIRYDNDCSDLTDDGQKVKNPKNITSFVTYFNAVEYADENIPLEKWVLVEYETTDDIIPVNKAKQAKVERVRLSETVKNGNYSSTSLMRDFHRWGRSFPKGYMNYNANLPANTEIAKGYLRDMYSVKKVKVLEQFRIKFCCDDPTFNPDELVKMPNGEIAQIGSVDFEFSSQELVFNVLADSACNIGVTYPEDTEGEECEDAGTLLEEIVYEDTCYMYVGDPCEQDPRIRDEYANVTLTKYRRIYADGTCNTYQTESPCPVAANYKEIGSNNILTAQQWLNLATDEDRGFYEPVMQC